MSNWRSCIVLTLCYLTTICYAQRECGYIPYLKLLSKDNPQVYEEIRDTETKLKKYVFKRQENAIPRKVRVIPVVVHIIWKDKRDNISDRQVHSQIQVLNEDYRKKRGTKGYTRHPLATDTMIEFRLAKVDAHWRKTTGITRTRTKVSVFQLEQMKFSELGGKDAWDTTRFLNIWVCRVRGGLLGYAQFPNGSRSLGQEKTNTTDGVVIGTRFFGRGGSAKKPFDLGRTATHEVGHWLGLRHIWGDGGCDKDDGVSDTPLAGRPNRGHPRQRPHSCGSEDMFENYMDYCDDNVQNVFTYEQAQRMNATLTLYRLGLCEWDAFGSGVDNGEVSGDDFFSDDANKNKDDDGGDFFDDH
ncbi:zinc metalloprotease [Candidatus Uabimicrobium amorphum]|uniref:Zinc metalloprotease n=1 Tax=Uabimicrobium amorphum TaxID=2596890 RepID=A0A5S9ITY2_UABAM|nr:zinc metalloprotease [Candidatus Uabimicrobium amorphum]BBM86545.1 zinc metalloprotease [Candidatus Uabimicrobium amorphum]